MSVWIRVKQFSDIKSRNVFWTEMRASIGILLRVFEFDFASHTPIGWLAFASLDCREESVH